MANRISALLWVWERLAFSAYAGPVVQIFNTITPLPGPLTERKQAKMRKGRGNVISLMARVHISALFSLRHGMQTGKKKIDGKHCNWWPRNKEWSWLRCKTAVSRHLTTRKSSEPTGFIQMSVGRGLINCCVIELGFRDVACGKWSSYQWCSSLWFFFVWGCVAATPALASSAPTSNISLRYLMFQGICTLYFKQIKLWICTRLH